MIASRILIQQRSLRSDSHGKAISLLIIVVGGTSNLIWFVDLLQMGIVIDLKERKIMSLSPLPPPASPVSGRH